MVRVFLTGASGYIGGDALYSISKALPDVTISALIRDSASGSQILKAYPAVNVVHGELDDTEIIEHEASKADVALHLAATGHLKSVQAIHKGLAKRKSGYYVQISGATILSQKEIQNNIYGEASDEIFDDVEHIDGLRNQIKRYPNRTVDNYILNVTKETPHVRTALVVGPIIYGKGRGPVKQRSVQIPELCRIAIERRRAIQIGKGLNIWNSVNIADLSELFLSLIREAAKGSTEENIWGPNGLYFTGTGSELSFGAISQQIASLAKNRGLADDDQVDSITAKEADELKPHFSAIVGTNARENAQRAARMLDWKSAHESLPEEIPRCFAEEAERAGK